MTTIRNPHALTAALLASKLYNQIAPGIGFGKVPWDKLPEHYRKTFTEGAEKVLKDLADEGILGE